MTNDFKPYAPDNKDLVTGCKMLCCLCTFFYCDGPCRECSHGSGVASDGLGFIVDESIRVSPEVNKLICRRLFGIDTPRDIPERCRNCKNHPLKNNSPQAQPEKCGECVHESNWEAF